MSLNHIAETLSASDHETFVKKAAFRLYENKTRAVSDPPRRKSRNERYLEQLDSEMSHFMWRLTFYNFAAEILVIRLAKT